MWYINCYMLDVSLTSEVRPGAGWWPPLDPNSGLFEPEPRSEVCSVTRVSAASSSRESSRPRPFSMYLPSLSNSVPYRLTFIWKYHKCANTLYKYWSITDNIGLKYVFFYFNFFQQYFLQVPCRFYSRIFSLFQSSSPASVQQPRKTSVFWNNLLTKQWIFNYEKHRNFPSPSEPERPTD